jgi:hypothetical protein
MTENKNVKEKLHLNKAKLNNRYKGEYFAVYDGRGHGLCLAGISAELLAAQKKTWPALDDGYAALGASLVKEIDVGVGKAQIQCNPHRIFSSGAKVDPAAIQKRPCFLCPNNLPQEQKAILYRNTYHILCNPMPIFDGHLTIPHVRHIPQSLAENIEMTLMLADDFGPDMVIFYNGPRAGASAPDHLHFQAAPRGQMPLEEDLRKQVGKAKKKQIGKITLFRTTGLGRGVLVIRGSNGDAIVSTVRGVLAILGDMTATEGEPLLNALCRRCEEGWELLIFPRLKHRPDVFYAQGEQQFIISPGLADMSGVIIAPREKDFHRLTAEMIASIYREVVFDDAMVEKVLSQL